jgi:hypothetical protein
MTDLAQHFHLPINAAAKELGICPTVLKKICRRNGMRRWPHRKVEVLSALFLVSKHLLLLRITYSHNLLAPGLSLDLFKSVLFLRVNHPTWCLMCLPL